MGFTGRTSDSELSWNSATQFEFQSGSKSKSSHDSSSKINQNDMNIMMLPNGKLTYQEKMENYLKNKKARAKIQQPKLGQNLNTHSWNKHGSYRYNKVDEQAPQK